MWNFIQTQVLGMKWLNTLSGELLSAIGLDIDSRIGSGIHFYIYDVIKITILLCLLIFVISYIQSFFPPERSRRIMGRFHGIWANIIGALLGTVTPFCSCSSIFTIHTFFKNAKIFFVSHWVAKFKTACSQIQRKNSFFSLSYHSTISINIQTKVLDKSSTIVYFFAIFFL